MEHEHERAKPNRRYPSQLWMCVRSYMNMMADFPYCYVCPSSICEWGHAC